MAILGCNFNINFGQTLAPGSSLCNTLRTKLHAWTESSIIVEFMVKFIWQHNLPVGSYHTFKMPPGRLDFWCSKGKKWDPPVTPKLKVREVSQSGFWNISSHPTSVPSFSQNGWPQFFSSGTLSQTMTLKTQISYNTHFFGEIAIVELTVLEKAPKNSIPRSQRDATFPGRREFNLIRSPLIDRRPRPDAKSV